MRPEPRAGGWCRPASSARSTISTSRAWNRIPGSGAATPPVFYDPATGVLHNEALGAASGVWAVASRGWVQESWPRAMKDACPDVGVAGGPAGQREADLNRVRQDDGAGYGRAAGAAFRAPNCADREPPASRRRGGVQPCRRRRSSASSKITTAGCWSTIPVRATFWCSVRDRDELWLLDGSGGTGGGAIADTGHLVPAAGGAEIALHYERLPLRPRFRVGDALPLLPTGERYAAMRLTDWLAAQSEPGHAALHGGQGFRVPLPGGRNSYRGIGRRQRRSRDARCVALVARRTDRDPRRRGGGQQLSLARARRPSRVDARMTAAAHLRTLGVCLVAMVAAPGASALDAGSPSAPGIAITPRRWRPAPPR